ncbi:MAG: glycosyltransferase family 2 protein [Capsulimonas sp.]|uniref:glycosyltransferase family 2 protein n=1 Tax=Capsulimonas sp. TaxID=2494211 RepID=UPI003265D80F
MINLIMTIDPWRHDWLPQFVAHYRKIGVERFLISAHVDSDLSPEDKERIHAEVADTLKSVGVDWCGKIDCKFDAMAIRAYHDKIQSTMCQPSDWIVWADSDELQQYWDTLDVLTRQWDARGVNCVGGDFLDRIAENGNLPAFDPDIPLWKQFPYGNRLTRVLLQGRSMKVVCSKATVAVKFGNHDPTFEQKVKWETPRAVIHHFKWDNTVIERLKERLTDSWKERCWWWEQTQRFNDHVAQHGRINTDEIPMKLAGDPAAKLPKTLKLYAIGSFYKYRWLAQQLKATKSLSPQAAKA